MVISLFKIINWKECIYMICDTYKRCGQNRSKCIVGFLPTTMLTAVKCFARWLCIYELKIHKIGMVYTMHIVLHCIHCICTYIRNGIRINCNILQVEFCFHFRKLLSWSCRKIDSHFIYLIMVDGICNTGMNMDVIY